MTIGIAGARGMGAGIAQLALQHGMAAILYDQRAQALEDARARIERGLRAAAGHGDPVHDLEAKLDRLQIVTDLAAFGEVAFVIDALADALEPKRALLAKLEPLCAPGTILACNTGSLSVSALAAGAQAPERMIGVHFLAPVATVKLVEVIPGLRTAQDIVRRTLDLLDSLEKTPVLVKNRPGFIVNRLAQPLYAEALRIFEEGAADAPTIDDLVKAMGFRTGPLEQMDIIGLDSQLALVTALHRAAYGEPRYQPSALLAEMVDAGQLGRRAGKGFYDY